MPGRDQRGPLGTGPASGRGMGYCGGNGKAAFSGFRFGRGSGLGYQNRYCVRGIQPAEYDTAFSSAPYVERETDSLKEELRHAEEILKNIKNRIAFSEKESNKSG